MTNAEYRAASWETSDTGKKITGRAIVFGSRTVLYKDPETGIEYGEIIDPHALDGADLSDVILRLEHQGPVLARTRNGSLKLTVTSAGLNITADMDQSDEARSVYESIKNGLYDRMSFAFVLAPGGETWDSVSHTRTVHGMEKVMDVAIVAFPAYQETQLNARSHFEALAAPDRRAFQERETRAIKLEIEERMSGYIPDYATPESFKSREEIERIRAHNQTVPFICRQRIDERDPVFREMAILRRDWETTVGNANLAMARETRQKFNDLLAELRDIAAGRNKTIAKIIAGEGKAIHRFSPDQTGRKEKESMENIEIRAFQKYVAAGSMKNLTAEERAAIVTSGAGAVMPTQIFNMMITGNKYSDLLSRATILNVNGAGNVKVPVASSNTATWKAEGAAVDPSNPTLSSIDLGGKELMRAIQYSAAVEHMSAGQFTEWMSNLCASEVVETLENTFVSGDATDDSPHNGLQNLTWTPNKNAVTATTAITAADVAKGLSLLPQKYARNAILLMNANTAYNTVGLFKGTSEYAYSLADGAARFMSKEINISEYCADDEIYIIDPAQLYVRFALQPVVEVDKSVGFLSAASTMRCLTVVDFAWNPAAAVRVAVGA